MKICASLESTLKISAFQIAVFLISGMVITSFVVSFIEGKAIASK